MSTIALKAATRFWFAVAVSGQLIFATYIALLYSITALRGHLELWKHRLIPGDGIGNAAFVAHLICAVILTAGGASQLVPQLRQRAPRFHRWMGRTFIATAFITSIAGLFMLWMRGTVGSAAALAGTTLNAVLIMLFAVIALVTAMTRRIAAHRRWALRLFLVANGSWFFRVGLFCWLIVNRGPAGFDPKTFSGPFITFLVFAESLLPLAVLELYLRAQQRGAGARWAMAAVLVVLTVAMGLGVFGATMGIWLPPLRKAL